MAEKIEKKISRVMRWLERCTLSCRGESYGSALMDIECARADFDSARDEIWNAAHKQHVPARGNLYFSRFFRAVAAAAAILLASAAPLSFLENLEKTEANLTVDVAGNSLEWVNSDEKALLANLRERLSDANSGWVPDLTDFSAPASLSAPVAKYSQAPKIERRKASDSSGKPEKAASEERGFTGERSLKNNKTDIKNETQIFTLLKIGENALKNNPSAVTIER